jgi:hypothetical protein
LELYGVRARFFRGLDQLERTLDVTIMVAR